MRPPQPASYVSRKRTLPVDRIAFDLNKRSKDEISAEQIAHFIADQIEEPSKILLQSFVFY